jgi:subtilisin family serine protease
MRRFTLSVRVLCSIAAALMVMGAFASSPAQASVANAAPVDGADNPGAIRDRYIVVFEKGASPAVARVAQVEAKANGGRVHHVYGNALQGFAATLPAPALDAMRRNPHVTSISADVVMTASTTQSPAVWGLDRLDQRALPLTNSYDYATGASNVTAYVIDTGLRLTHSEFGGRAVSGFDSVDGGSADDCNGHGTHVAGTLGGATYGVAKAVRLVAVRVLDCAGSGSTSGVIAGIDWVTSHHQAGQPAVANMSLGGGASSALDTAIANSIADGVTYAVAAGNSNANACNSSPSRLPAAITVGASTISDARASFSNFGTCLDLFAPGQNITSAWLTSDTSTNTISGTSMATPHVAGAAALYLSANPAAAPAAVRDALVNSSTTEVITNVGSGSPNRLLYTRGGATPTPAPTPTPVCGGLPQQYRGSLSGTGASQNQPNGTYYTATVAGIHRGCLDGPTGVDFDLYLQKWDGSAWVTVASSLSTSPDESVAYKGAAGYYTWKVLSYSGSGSYLFGMQTP